MARSIYTTVVLASCVAAAGLQTRSAKADEMGWIGLGVRIGYVNPGLKADAVPLLGKALQDKCKKANALIDTYNTATGSNVPHYVMSDLNLDSKMLQITPSLHLGGSGFFMKLEAPMAFSTELKTIGFGLYPINVGVHLETLSLFPYVSAGGVVSYATSTQFTPTGGSTIKVNAKGALIETRLALGLKLFLVDNLPISVELGYSPYAIGLVVDNNRPKPQSGVAQLPEHPGAAARGGIGSAFNTVVGIDWL
jgi:hypothetical protein